MKYAAWLVGLATATFAAEFAFAQFTPPMSPEPGDATFCAQNYIGSANGIYYYETAVLSSGVCGQPFGTGYSNNLYVEPISCGGTNNDCNVVVVTATKSAVSTSRVLIVTNKPSAIAALKVLDGRLAEMLLAANRPFLSGEQTIKMQDDEGEETANISRRELTQELQDYVANCLDALEMNTGTYAEFKREFEVYYPQFWQHFGYVQNGGDGTAETPRRIVKDSCRPQQRSQVDVDWRPPRRLPKSYYAQAVVNGTTRYFQILVGKGTRVRNANNAKTIIAQQIDTRPNVPNGKIDRYRLVDCYANNHVMIHESGTNRPRWLRNRKIIVSTYDDLGFGLPDVSFQ